MAKPGSGRSVFCTTAGVLLPMIVLWAAMQPQAESNASPTCASASLVAIADLLGCADREAVDRAAATLSHADVSLLEIRDAGRAVGLDLVGMSATVSELLARRCPAIVHLRAPDHFTVLAGASASHAVVVDGTAVALLERGVLDRRFSGAALVPASAVHPSLGICVPQPVQKVEFASAADRLVSVPLVNKGRTPVTIGVHRVACSCSDAALSSDTIEPGRTASLSVRLRPAAWGTTLQSVTLRTDDPVCPRLLILFRVAMSTAVVAEPAQLVIRGPQGRPATRRVLVRTVEGGAVTSCATRSGFLNAHVAAQETSTRGTTIRIEVTLSPAAPTGDFVDDLTVRLRGAGVPQIRVPITGSVEPDVAAHPREAFFGIVAPGSRGRRTIVIESAGRKAFAIESVACTDKRVHVRVDYGREVVLQEVAVEVEALGEPGAIIRDKVKVTLTDGRMIEFSVFAMIGPAEEGQEKP